MLTYSAEDVISALRSAKNLNAAVKNFLKKEAGGDPRPAQYAKQLRSAFEAPLPERGDAFVRQSAAQNEAVLVSIARFAYVEQMTRVIGKIVEKHAEKFGATYEPSAEGITVKDRAKFESITKAVVKDLDTYLADEGMPVSNFLKNAVLAFLFEQDVFKEVIPVLKGIK